MFDVKQITDLHRATVAGWHQHDINNTYDGFLEIVCRQHSFNFLLWHEEDIARSQDVDDSRIAQVKRAIDGYNQQRNDWIERMDEAIADIVDRQGIDSAGPLNTETPGSVIDRLSIIALRGFHLEEQLQRSGVREKQRQAVRQKIEICRLQQGELSQSLLELLADIFAGRKRHRTYRQLKMYNDPKLNPYLDAGPVDAA